MYVYNLGDEKINICAQDLAAKMYEACEDMDARDYDETSAIDMVTSTINYFIEIYGLTEDAKKSIFNCLDGKIEKKDIDKIFYYLKKMEG